MTSEKGAQDDYPMLLFATPEEWVAWLEENHTTTQGLWVRLAKKASGIPSIDYQQALEAALCFGWIDGQKKSFDESSWLQKFTPRRAKSIWSKINRDKAEALIASGQMRPAGLAAIQAAQADGRWDAAYDSQSNASVPEDFVAALEANAEAKAFFDTLNRTNRYAILFRIHQAKRAETRAKRIADFVAMLARQEKIYP